MKDPKSIITYKRYGFIHLTKYPDYAFIDAFVIYEKYRGKKKARKLAQYLPRQCRLLAQPLVGCPLSVEQLIDFYKSLGFKLEPDINKNNLMVRL